jgi:hypothetical protein
MIKTGKINQITGDEILQIEESDIDFWDTNWEELTLEQKADICSLIKAPFLGKQNEDAIKGWYEYYKLKNTMEL